MAEIPTTRCPTKEEWNGLWAILWRLVLFGPILLPLGFGLLMIALGLLAGPPIYAARAIANGQWLMGLTIAAVWCCTLRLTRGLLRRLFEGIEYSGI